MPINTKHSLEDQLEEVNKMVKRLGRQIEKLNKRLEISQKKAGRFNAELQQNCLDRIQKEWDYKTGNKDKIGAVLHPRKRKNASRHRRRVTS